MSDPERSTWLRVMPPLFVALWSTGFIGARFGLPYAEPLTFLVLRMVAVTAILTLLALATGAPWPRRWRDAGHIAVAGLLVHALYLGGVFCAIGAGLSAGVTALIVGLQPLLTAIGVGPLLGERISRAQWLGFLLGLAGVVLVVWEKLALGSGQWGGLAFALAALAGITLGTLYQKRFCTGMDLRTGAAIQYAATGTVLAVVAARFESGHVAWTGSFLFALAWLVLVLSVGAVFLLFAMIRRGAAARVASLFYLTPAVTALFAWALFGEHLGWLALGGMALVALGVALVNR